MEPLKPSRSLRGFSDAGDTLRDGTESYVYFHIEPKYTNYINRIFEGYEYVGVMTTLDPEGRYMIRCTDGTRPLALDILRSLDDCVTIESEWES